MAKISAWVEVVGEELKMVDQVGENQGWGKIREEAFN